MGEAEDLTRLEQLRHRKRSDLKEGLVQAVMVQATGLDEKIRRIEMIDLMPDEPAPTPPPAKRPSRGALIRPAPREPAAPPPGGPAEGPRVDPALTERQRVEHHRRHLGRVPASSGWWVYLTQGYGQLVRLILPNGLLKTGWIPFQLGISAEAILVLQSLPSSAAVLEQALPTVGRTAWMVLTKTDFNLLVALRDLVLGLREVTLPPKPRGWKPYWTAFSSLLPSVSLFFSAPGLVEQTLVAWEQAALKVGLGDRVRVSGAEAIRVLLDPKVPGLVVALEALLVLQLKRPARIQDLVPEGPGEYLVKDGFEVGPEVQAEIDRALGQLTGRIDVLIKELRDVRRIRYFVPTAPVLEDFMASFDPSDKKVWVLHFLERAAESMGPLLTGTVALAGGFRTEVLKHPPLTAVMARLAELHDHLIDPLKGADPGLVGDVARVVTNLGKTLVVQILQRSRAADPLVRSGEEPDAPLACEEELVEEPLEWAGMRVIDALVRTAQVCLLAGRFLGETSLEAPLGREESLRAQAEEILVRITRMAPSSVARERRGAWDQACGGPAEPSGPPESP